MIDVTQDATQVLLDHPTEGVPATGLFELAAPSGLRLRVIREQIFVFPETDAIYTALALVR